MHLPPDEKAAHVGKAACIEATDVLGTAELATTTPATRAWRGGRLCCGLGCGYGRRVVGPCLSRCTRRWAGRVRQSKGQAIRLDPDSESESAPEEDACEAEKVAYLEGTTTKLLAGRECRDTARQREVKM